MKRRLSLLLCLVMILSLFAGCGSDADTETTPETETVEATKPIIPSVRILLFQPELEADWQALATDYTAATGVPVTVTAWPLENWEQTLAVQLDDEDTPSLFQIYRPSGTSGWEALCYDVTSTDAADGLVDQDYALKEGTSVLGLPLGVNAWGIWVNRTLLEQAGFRLEDVTTQDALKTVVESVAANADTLGFSAFPAICCDTEDHMAMAATAIALEYHQKKLKSPDAFQGRTLEGLHSLLSLMLTNSPEGDEDAFRKGKALFCFGSYADLPGLSESLAPEELALIPAYLDETPVADLTEETEPTEETDPQETTPEETEPEEPEPQGLCIGADFFLCVNRQTPDYDLDVTLDFLDYLLGSEKGAEALAALGYTLPYTTAPENENLPALESRDILHRRDWAMPSEQWKTALDRAMTVYIAEPTATNWDTVVDVFAGYWAAEYALTAGAQS